MSESRRSFAAILASAVVVLFALKGWQLLGVLPGWQALSAALRRVDPQAPNAVLSLLEILLACLSVFVVRRLGCGGGATAGRGLLAWLGLARSPGAALRLVGTALVPLYLVFAVMLPLARDVAGFGVLYLAFIGPLAEEVVFRGVAFGLLRRVARWPFWIAALVPALIFGLGHANPFVAFPAIDDIMTFAITASGAFIFSWLYERWRFDLWVPFFLHAFMNFAWSLFRVGEGAFAGWLPTAMQVTSLTLAILLTLRRNRAARELTADSKFN